MRLYAGIWILVIALLIVAVDGSRLLVYVTRFTEDIFATLISAIFIAESLHFVYHVRWCLKAASPYPLFLLYNPTQSTVGLDIPREPGRGLQVLPGHPH